MMPVLPHIASECLEKFSFSDKVEWPDINQKYINNEENEIVIQVNGKKRNTILLKQDISEEELKEKIEVTKLIDKYLIDKKLIKTIYVKNRLINYIIK